MGTNCVLGFLPIIKLTSANASSKTKLPSFPIKFIVIKSEIELLSFLYESSVKNDDGITHPITPSSLKLSIDFTKRHLLG